VVLLVGNGSPGLSSKAKQREKREKSETHRVKGAIDILMVLW